MFQLRNDKSRHNGHSIACTKEEIKSWRIEKVWPTNLMQHCFSAPEYGMWGLHKDPCYLPCQTFEIHQMKSKETKHLKEKSNQCNDED